MLLRTLFVLACVSSLNACDDWNWCCWRSSSANDQTNVELVNLTTENSLDLEIKDLPDGSNFLAASPGKKTSLEYVYTKFVIGALQATGKAEFDKVEQTIKYIKPAGLSEDLSARILVWKNDKKEWNAATLLNGSFESLKNLSEKWECDIKDVDDLKSKLGDKAKDKSDGSWYADLEGCFIFVDATKKCFCSLKSGKKEIDGITFSAKCGEDGKKTVKFKLKQGPQVNPQPDPQQEPAQPDPQQEPALIDQQKLNDAILDIIRDPLTKLRRCVEWDEATGKEFINKEVIIEVLRRSFCGSGGYHHRAAHYDSFEPSRYNDSDVFVLETGAGLICLIGIKNGLLRWTNLNFEYIKTAEDSCESTHAQYAELQGLLADEQQLRFGYRLTPECKKALDANGIPAKCILVQEGYNKEGLCKAWVDFIVGKDIQNTMNSYPVEFAEENSVMYYDKPLRLFPANPSWIFFAGVNRGGPNGLPRYVALQLESDTAVTFKSVTNLDDLQFDFSDDCLKLENGIDIFPDLDSRGIEEYIVRFEGEFGGDYFVWVDKSANTCYSNMFAPKDPNIPTNDFTTNRKVKTKSNSVQGTSVPIEFEFGVYTENGYRKLKCRKIKQYTPEERLEILSKRKIPDALSFQKAIDINRIILKERQFLGLYKLDTPTIPDQLKTDIEAVLENKPVTYAKPVHPNWFHPQNDDVFILNYQDNGILKTCIITQKDDYLGWVNVDLESVGGAKDSHESVIRFYADKRRLKINADGCVGYKLNSDINHGKITQVSPFQVNQEYSERLLLQEVKELNVAEGYVYGKTPYELFKPSGRIVSTDGIVFGLKENVFEKIGKVEYIHDKWRCRIKDSGILKPFCEKRAAYYVKRFRDGRDRYFIAMHERSGECYSNITSSQELWTLDGKEKFRFTVYPNRLIDWTLTMSNKAMFDKGKSIQIFVSSPSQEEKIEISNIISDPQSFVYDCTGVTQEALKTDAALIAENKEPINIRLVPDAKKNVKSLKQSKVLILCHNDKWHVVANGLINEDNPFHWADINLNPVTSSASYESFLENYVERMDLSRDVNGRIGYKVNTNSGAFWDLMPPAISEKGFIIRRGRKGDDSSLLVKCIQGLEEAIAVKIDSSEQRIYHYDDFGETFEFRLDDSLLLAFQHEGAWRAALLKFTKKGFIFMTNLGGYECGKISHKVLDAEGLKEVLPKNADGNWVGCFGDYFVFVDPKSGKASSNIDKSQTLTTLDGKLEFEFTVDDDENIAWKRLGNAETLSPEEKEQHKQIRVLIEASISKSALLKFTGEVNTLKQSICGLIQQGKNDGFELIDQLGFVPEERDIFVFPNASENYAIAQMKDGRLRWVDVDLNDVDEKSSVQSFYNSHYAKYGGQVSDDCKFVFYSLGESAINALKDKNAFVVGTSEAKLTIDMSTPYSRYILGIPEERPFRLYIEADKGQINFGMDWDTSLSNNLGLLSTNCIAFTDSENKPDNIVIQFNDQTGKFEMMTEKAKDVSKEWACDVDFEPDPNASGPITKAIAFAETSLLLKFIGGGFVYKQLATNEYFSNMTPLPMIANGLYPSSAVLFKTETRFALGRSLEVRDGKRVIKVAFLPGLHILSQNGEIDVSPQ